MDKPIKKILRSTTDRKVAGVCGGLGKYFAVDPVIFRVIFVLSAIFGGVGLVAYLVMWLVIHEDTHQG